MKKIVRAKSIDLAKPQNWGRLENFLTEFYSGGTLQPFLVIFKEEWMDGVILHEIAHYKYKHHRKSFWDFLSKLIGEDSKIANVKHDIALSPYYGYYIYLTKNK